MPVKNNNDSKLSSKNSDNESESYNNSNKSFMMDDISPIKKNIVILKKYIFNYFYL